MYADNVVGNQKSGVLTGLLMWLQTLFPPLAKHDGSLARLLALGGVYFLLFVMAIAQLLRSHFRLNKKITKQKLFFIFISFCAIIRAVFFISFAFVPTPLFLTYSLDATLLEIILSNLPGYIFFSTYCLLIVYWAEVRVSNMVTNLKVYNLN